MKLGPLHFFLRPFKFRLLRIGDGWQWRCGWLMVVRYPKIRKDD